MARPKGAPSAWERQAQLLEVLQQGWTTSETLQELVDKPERTVRRDLEVLVQHGHQVEERWNGRHKEWRVNPESVRRPIEPGVLELIALNLGRGLLGFLEGTELAGQMNGLFSELRRASRASDQQVQDFDRKFWFMADAPRDYSAADDALNEVCTCVLNQRLADVWYRSRGQSPRAFRIAPYTLVVRRECLYVLARVVDSDEIRLFDVTRLLSVKRRRERFEIPDDFRPAEAFRSSFGVFIQGVDPPVQVRLLFDPDVATSIENRRWHSSQRWEEHPEGRVLVMSVRVCPELMRWILGFGPTVRVLSPPVLVERVRDSLRQTVAGYPEADI